MKQSKESRIADLADFAKDQRRDAHATIAGFVFQVNTTIRQWLELRSDEYLELEAGEDIDLIHADANSQETDFSRLLMQLKQLTDGSLTLRKQRRS